MYEFIADFESAHAGQILRHRHAEAEHLRDLRQLPLLAEDDGDPFSSLEEPPSDGGGVTPIDPQLT